MLSEIVEGAPPRPTDELLRCGAIRQGMLLRAPKAPALLQLLLLPWCGWALGWMEAVPSMTPSAS